MTRDELWTVEHRGHPHPHLSHIWHPSGSLMDACGDELPQVLVREALELVVPR